LFAVVADGAGALQPANPNDVTDQFCGVFEMSIQLGPAGLPPGLSINVQGGVVTTTSVPPPPNGLFHITELATINT
jgi:hypothetical protein